MHSVALINKHLWIAPTPKQSKLTETVAGCRLREGGEGWFLSLSHENVDCEAVCRWGTGTHAKNCKQIMCHVCEVYS